jgi:hypothetical protein
MTNLSTLDDDDLEAEWEWQAEPDACPACLEYDGLVMTLMEWMDFAIPGKAEGDFIMDEETSYQYGEFGTFCEEHCRCHLRKV